MVTRSAQRGVVLILSLIILAVMLISAAALVRSFETTLFSSGNLVFKRDLANQGERAAAAVLKEFKPAGALGTTASRANALKSQNYSAVVLDSNAQGLPRALLDDTLFAAVASATDITPPGSTATTIRYLVDRMCTEVGEDQLLGPDKCSVAENTLLPGGSASNWRGGGAERGSRGGKGAVAQAVVYRISVRVSGPRNTQAFYQTTFTN